MNKWQWHYLHLLLCGLLSVPLVARAAEPSPTFIESTGPLLRAMLYQPILDTVVKFNNEQSLVLGRLTPQGASFFAGAEKVAGEKFDATRQRATLSIAVTTCNGATGWDAKISGISVWEALPWDAEHNSGPGPYAAYHLEKVLETITGTDGITTPNSVRSPRVVELDGPVFEYIKGNTIQTVSLLNDTNAKDQRLRLMMNWTISDSSSCPK